MKRRKYWTCKQQEYQLVRGIGRRLEVYLKPSRSPLHSRVWGWYYISGEHVQEDGIAGSLTAAKRMALQAEKRFLAKKKKGGVMRNPSTQVCCKVCTGPLVKLGALGPVTYYRCRDCGMDCGIERRRRKKGSKKNPKICVYAVCFSDGMGTCVESTSKAAATTLARKIYCRSTRKKRCPRVKSVTIVRCKPNRRRKKKARRR